MSGSAGETARGLRDRPLGRILILVVVLVAALLVARTCGATETELSKEDAIDIARDRVEYEPDLVQVRLLKRGLQSNEYWAVSLSGREADGSLGQVTVVVVDAKTGDVAEIRRGA